MRATWSAPGGNTFQGANNSLQVIVNNTIKRALKYGQNALWMDHQQDDVVSGGNSETIQFHYLLKADTAPMTATSAAAGAFDANTGSAGPTGPTGSVNTSKTAQYVFETRRDFKPDSRGF